MSQHDDIPTAMRNFIFQRLDALIDEVVNRGWSHPEAIIFLRQLSGELSEKLHYELRHLNDDGYTELQKAFVCKLIHEKPGIQRTEIVNAVGLPHRTVFAICDELEREHKIHEH